MTAAFPQQMVLDDDLGTLILATMDCRTLSKEQPSSPAQNQSHSQTPATPQQVRSPASSPLPPPLPERNARRNSRFLDALLDAKTPSAADAAPAVSAPLPMTSDNAAQPTLHDVYLSSEEDASSMGELSDFEDEEGAYDSDGVVVVVQTTSITLPPVASATSTSSAETRALPTRRHSHDTARVISVVFAGKPSLVDLALERAARRRSLNDRATSPSPSASSSTSSASDAFTRPSTSSGSVLSTAPSSTTTSPQRHKRNSSGSMLASFRARKMAVTTGVTPVPVPSNLDTSPSPSPLGLPLAAPIRSFTAPVLVPPPPTASSTTTSSSSPRTPTFGQGNLLRGMTRSLTLSRRLARPQLKETAVPTPPTVVAAPADARPVEAVPAPTYNEIVRAAASRKSLALSVVSSVTAMNAPPPAPPTPDFDEARSFTVRRASTTAGRLAMPPAATVSSKKGGKFLGNLTGRRRSLKLL